MNVADSLAIVASNPPALRDAFAVVLLAPGRSAAYPIIRRALAVGGRETPVIYEGQPYFAGYFERTGPDLAALQNILILGHGLRTMFVLFQGRLYGAGSKDRLYQMLACYTARWAAQEAPAACGYTGIAGYILPCHLQGAFATGRVSREGDVIAQAKEIARAEGFDRCPRFRADGYDCHLRTIRAIGE